MDLLLIRIMGVLSVAFVYQLSVKLVKHYHAADEVFDLFDTSKDEHFKS